MSGQTLVWPKSGLRHPNNSGSNPCVCYVDDSCVVLGKLLNISKGRYCPYCRLVINFSLTRHPLPSHHSLCVSGLCSLPQTCTRGPPTFHFLSFCLEGLDLPGLAPDHWGLRLSPRGAQPAPGQHLLSMSTSTLSPRCLCLVLTSFSSYTKQDLELALFSFEKFIILIVRTYGVQYEHLIYVQCVMLKSRQ
jgi:hypothetical protein